jgi:hypothetical protein
VRRLRQQGEKYFSFIAPINAI